MRGRFVIPGTASEYGTILKTLWRLDKSNIDSVLEPVTVLSWEASEWGVRVLGSELSATPLPYSGTSCGSGKLVPFAGYGKSYEGCVVLCDVKGSMHKFRVCYVAALKSGAEAVIAYDSSGTPPTYTTVSSLGYRRMPCTPARLPVFWVSSSDGERLRKLVEKGREVMVEFWLESKEFRSVGYNIVVEFPGHDDKYVLLCTSHDAFPWTTHVVNELHEKLLGVVERLARRVRFRVGVRAVSFTANIVGRLTWQLWTWGLGPEQHFARFCEDYVTCIVLDPRMETYRSPELSKSPILPSPYTIGYVALKHGVPTLALHEGITERTLEKLVEAFCEGRVRVNSEGALEYVSRTVRRFGVEVSLSRRCISRELYKVLMSPVFIGRYETNVYGTLQTYLPPHTAILDDPGYGFAYLADTDTPLYDTSEAGLSHWIDVLREDLLYKLDAIANL